MRIHPSTYIRVPFNGVSSIMLCPTLALQASLSSGSMLARPHLSTHGVTHSDNVLRGLSFFLLPGSGNFVKYLIDGMDRFTWPYHLSHRQQRTNVMSSMPSFSSSEAEGVLSLYLMPQIQWVMTRSLHWRHRSLGSFGPHVSLPWSIAEQTPAWYTLRHILGERCLVVRTGKRFLNFSQATQNVAAMALPHPPPKHSISSR